MDDCVISMDDRVTEGPSPTRPGGNRMLRYDMDEAVRTLAAADATLAALIERAGPLPIREGEAEPFAALLRSILYQQLAGKAAATIHGRVLALLPDGGPPAPAAFLEIPDEALRAAGVSRNKVAALKDLSRKTLDGSVPDRGKLERLGDAEVIDRLTQVRGIGVWTVQMLLLFDLGRPDVLPTGDLGVRRGYQLTYRLSDLPTPAALEAAGDAWRPYRSVASGYLWRAVHLARTT